MNLEELQAKLGPEYSNLRIEDNGIFGKMLYGDGDGFEFMCGINEHTNIDVIVERAHREARYFKQDRENKE